MVKIVWCEVMSKLKLYWTLLCGLVLLLVWLPDIIRYRHEQSLKAQYEALLEQESFKNFLIVKSVNVGNSTLGSPILMDVDRTIIEPFIGDYNVMLREFPGRALVCRAGDDNIPYDPSNELPDPLTLHWWADNGSCSGPKDGYLGDFVIETTWIKHNESLGIPNESVTVVSNPFTITPLSPQEAEEVVTEQKSLQRQLEELQEEVRALKGE